MFRVIAYFYDFIPGLQSLATGDPYEHGKNKETKEPKYSIACFMYKQGSSLN